jgi:hypothetical protein
MFRLGCADAFSAAPQQYATSVWGGRTASGLLLLRPAELRSCLRELLGPAPLRLQ